MKKYSADTVNGGKSQGVFDEKQHQVLELMDIIGMDSLQAQYEVLKTAFIDASRKQDASARGDAEKHARAMCQTMNFHKQLREKAKWLILSGDSEDLHHHLEMFTFTGEDEETQVSYRFITMLYFIYILRHELLT